MVTEIRSMKKLSYYNYGTNPWSIWVALTICDLNLFEKISFAYFGPYFCYKKMQYAKFTPFNQSIVSKIEVTHILKK